jgi:hypothetical protein
MTENRRADTALDIAALAHGKALYSLTPVIEALGPDKREAVFLYLAREYQGLADAIARLLGRQVPYGTPAPENRHVVQPDSGQGGGEL